MTDTLDQSIVEGLKELGGEDDPELFGELVDAFMADTPGRLDSIDKSIAAGDTEGVAQAAHPLKSSSANMGAMGLSVICKRLEMEAREGKLEGHGELAAQARVEYEAAAKALNDAR